jgi:hypothetical protein
MPKVTYENMTNLFTPKPFTDHQKTKLGQVTRYVEVTMLELLQKVRKEEILKHRKVGEEELCPICRCDLYEGLETQS